MAERDTSWKCWFPSLLLCIKGNTKQQDLLDVLSAVRSSTSHHNDCGRLSPLSSRCLAMMKRGAKRPALDSTGPDLRSRRVLDGSSFGVHRAEPSQPPPPADSQRVESSQKHVRALNTQFASWVQLQLQNHPDELWEDGVKDYLAHASHIMEKFKDVVDWLKANAAEPGAMSTTTLPCEQNILVAPSEKNKPNLRSDINNGFSQAATSARSPSLLTSGSLFSSQSSSSLVGQSTSSVFSSPQSSASSLSSHSTSSSLFSQSSGTSIFASQSSGTSTFASQSPGPSIFGSQSSGSLFSFQTSGSLFGSQSSPGSLFSPQSSNLFSSSQTPSFPGTQTSTLLKAENSSDINEEDEPEKPSSPSLKKTEEKGIVVVHEVKCKVYVKRDNPAEEGWKDMGVGQLSIKCKEGAGKATKESNPTIVIRNDAGKILLNALIYPGIKLNIQKKAIASIFHTSAGDSGGGGDDNKAVARMYLLRMRSEEETAKLATTINEHMPSS